jgi:catechol 2,3-dioxygenase-like lactoylglutathione lyase family enzyme
MTARTRYIVRDVDEAVRFYVDCLGFELQEQFGPAMAIVTCKGLSLWLAGPAASASRAMPNGHKPEPGGWNRIVLETAELESTVARLRAKGVTFRNEIVSGPGGLQILCDDPSGNPVELFEPPARSVSG